MCGRYISPDEAAYEREWSITPRDVKIFQSYNVHPGMDVPIIRADADNERDCILARWPLIPVWAKGEPVKFNTSNARSETMADELMTEIHNTKKRMPLIIDREDYDDWLVGDMQQAESLIVQYASARMEAWPVSTYVNKPANDDQRCIEPVG